jgi:hypothetical protein
VLTPLPIAIGNTTSGLKPIEIEVIQITGTDENIKEIKKFCGSWSFKRGGHIEFILDDNNDNNFKNRLFCVLTSARIVESRSAIAKPSRLLCLEGFLVSAI